MSIYGDLKFMRLQLPYNVDILLRLFTRTRLESVMEHSL